MTTARTPRRREAGLSRFDAMVGAGSLALLLLVAGVPGAADPAEAALAEATSTLRDTFEVARGLSLAAGAPYGVAVDPDGERLAVIDQQGRVAEAPEGFATFVELAPLGVDITRAAFGPGGSTAIYDGQGVPMAGGRIELQAGAADAVQTVRLVFDPATGWLDLAE